MDASTTAGHPILKIKRKHPSHRPSAGGLPVLQFPVPKSHDGIARIRWQLRPRARGPIGLRGGSKTEPQDQPKDLFGDFTQEMAKRRPVDGEGVPGFDHRRRGQGRLVRLDAHILSGQVLGLKGNRMRGDDWVFGNGVNHQEDTGDVRGLPQLTRGDRRGLVVFHG